MKTNRICALLLIFVISTLNSKTAFAVLENVAWVNATNVLAVGNTITKNSGSLVCDGCDDAGGQSSQQIISGDGYVEFTVPSNSSTMQVGLSQGPGSTNVTYASVTQGIRFSSSGWAEVYDTSNTWLCGAQFNPGDRFRVSVSGGLVTYLNVTQGQSICSLSMVIPLWPSYPLVLAASIARAGATLSNATISYTPPVSKVLQLGLDEASGAVSFLDSSGLGNIGSCSGTSCPESGVIGRVNYAAQFNGTSNFIQVAGTNELEPLTNVAVAAFIRASSASSSGSEIVSMGDNYALRLNPDGNALFFFYAGNNSWVPVYTSGVNLLDNQFHHLVGQKTDTGIEIYVDGTLRGSLSTTNSISYTLGTNFMIGRHGNGGTRFFNGIIDEVYIYNRPLSTSEIAALASAYTPPPSTIPPDPSRVVELPLNEAPGALFFQDISGNGNNGSCSSSSCPQAGMPGELGLAANFNGSSNFIQVSGNGTLRPATTVAVSAYFRTSSSGVSGEEIVSMGDDYAIRILANGNARFFYYAGNNTWYNVDSSGLNLLDNQIHHIVGQKTLSALEIYIDGQAVGSVSATGGIGYRAGGNLIIGRHGIDSARYFNGMIDEVYVYNRPLSGAEIMNLASNASLMASLSLDEPTGSVSFQDSSGHGNSGVCSGSSCPQAGYGGKIRAAALFNGLSNFIQVAGNAILRPSSGVAISAFIESAAVPSGADREEVISMGDDYSLSVLANGNVKFFYSNGSGSWIATVASQVNVLDNQFHHVLGQKTSSTVEVYVDGSLVASSPASGSIFYRAGGNLIIGKHGIDPTRFFNGIIDEVNVFNRSLNPKEIATLAGVAPSSTPGSIPIGVAPSTYTAYTGTDAIAVPPAPALGPAGYVFNDPTFGSRILRVTDANTAGGHSFISEEAGYAHAFNANSTAVKLMDGYNGSFWASFDPVGFRIAGGLNPVPFTGGFSNVWEWSAVNPDVIYFLNGNFIAQYNKATGAVTNLAGPAGGTIPVSYHVTIVGKDTWVCSTAGLEGQNMYTRVFCVQPNNTSQYFLMDIPNKTINGVWQSNSVWPYSANSGTPFGIHNINGSVGGQWLQIEFRGSGFGGNEVSVYNIATNTFNFMPNDNHNGGHTAIGDGLYVNAGGSINGMDDRGWTLRNPSNLADTTPPFDTFVGTLNATNGFFDGDHISWFNASTNPNAPFLSSRYHGYTAPGMPLTWWGEIIGVAVDGSNKVYRFAHNHATSLLYSQYGYSCANGDCFFAEGFAQISNDGRYAIFSSDWDRSLGPSGDFGIPTRLDVFILELK